ncbi:MAG: serine/threonine protein kinase, partial [Deltaproteobacteria bacterium]|nr:serine/threonine protein kinase [Deltaproteobacteria bacterium]
MSLPAGAVVQNRYQVVRLLGRGGMAAAYLVEDRLWNVQVALKLLEAPTPELRAAFHFEFGALRGLHHPRLSQVHDYGLLDCELGGGAEMRGTSDELEATTCFYTADYVAGQTLDPFARSSTWPELRAALCDALHALHLLHAVGIRHGDIKPSNILVGTDGRAVLIDLSCAAAVTRSAPPTGVGGSISGTPDYWAPELTAGGVVDERADLFAVGVTLQRLLPMVSTEAPPQVWELAERLTQPKPGDRPAEVDEVLEVLGAEPTLIHPVVAQLSRFAGRYDDLKQASAALEAMLRGEPGPRVLHVLGEEGTGRSGLLREIKWLAQQRCRVIECNPAATSAIDQLIGATESRDPLSAGEDGRKDRLDAVLHLREQVASRLGRPVVWMIDDAEKLEQGQQQQLLALCRVLEPTDGGLVVVSSLPGLAVEAPGLRRIELAPLTRSQIRQWVGDSLAERTWDQLSRLSGGSPATVRALLGQIASGQLSEDELERVTDPRDLSRRSLAVMGELDPATLHALGLLALVDRALPTDACEDLAIVQAALDHLLTLGTIERCLGGWQLLRKAEGASIRQALPPELRTKLHGELADWLSKQVQAVTSGEGSLQGQASASTETAATLAAEQVLHLAHAGRQETAATLLLDRAAWHGAAPLAWWRAGCALAEQDRDTPTVQLVVAQLERAAGHTKAALRRLTRLVTQGTTREESIPLRLELGSCHLELGAAESAKEHLEQVRGQASDPESRAVAAHLLARTALQHGAYRDAARLAQEGLEEGVAMATRADLLETAGVAQSFLGELASARHKLDEAAELLEGLDDPRRLVRSWGNRALLAYNMGDLGTALDRHHQAMELAERHGLSDQLATAALNFGTACHQSGRWADALSSYQRGMRMAVALGQLGNEALLRFNLAKLQADLGLFDRAQATAERCQQLAEQTGIPMLHGAAETVIAEVAAARGAPGRARDHLLAARSRLEQHGSLRDQAEVDIQLAEVLIVAGELTRAAARLDPWKTQLAGAEADDVECRLTLAQARLALAQGRSAEATSLAERATSEAGTLGQHELEAQGQALLVEAWDAQGAPTLADQHGTRARELWERTAAPLPAG